MCFSAYCCRFRAGGRVSEAGEALCKYDRESTVLVGVSKYDGYVEPVWFLFFSIYNVHSWRGFEV